MIGHEADGRDKQKTHIALWIDHAQRSPRVQRVAPAIVVAGAVAVAVVEGRHFLFYFLSSPVYVPFVQSKPVLSLVGLEIDLSYQ